jgi:FkbM family methyltransferase
VLIDSIKSLLRFLLQRNVYTVQHGLAKGLKRRGGFAFLKKELNKEEQFLLGLDLTGRTVYDVGGWEGVFTCFFARAVGPKGNVITFEPNPHCRKRILENVSLNHFENVRVLNVGLNSASGRDTLVFTTQSLGVGSVQKEIKEQLLAKRGALRVEIELDTLDHQVHLQSLPQPNFVKIDVEGLEYEVLKGMTETIGLFKPNLYIEIHGINEQQKLNNARNVITLLCESGYTIHHIESDQIITSQAFEIPQVGHLYCTVPDPLKP